MNRYAIYRAAFEALALTRLPHLLDRASRSRGVILTLHRVLPEPPAAFSPNAILQITPGFLEAVILRARQRGFEIIAIDEAVERIKIGQTGAPFIVLTFDDGYRDNFVHALPILRKYRTPFTLYIPTAFADGVGQIWWQALEDIIASHDMVVVPLPEGPHYGDAQTLEQKEELFAYIYKRYREMPEPQRIDSIIALAERYGFDLSAHCRDLVMDWAELQTFAGAPLCTVGAHTVHHYELSKLPEDEMRAEIEQSASIIEAQFGQRPKHLSYPIGGPEAAGIREFRAARDLGFGSAVTTRPGGIYPEHADHLHALPRISLNGYFQQKRFIDVLLSAETFRIMRKGKTLNVA